MSFGTATNGATLVTDPFNGFRPPYKIAQQITFPTITGRDAPNKTGSAARPALVTEIGLRVSGYDGDTATSRFGIWSSDGTNGEFSELFTLVTNNTPPLTYRELPDLRLVFSATKYWVGFTKTSTAQYTWGVDNTFSASIRQDNTNSGGTSNFVDNGLISPAGSTSNGSLIYGLKYDVLPTAPLTPVVSAVTNTATFTWDSPSSNGGALVLGYRIRRSTDNATWTTLVSNTLSTSRTYTDSNLTLGQTYYYQVAAINAVAVAAGSDYSGPFSASASVAIAGTAGNAQSLLVATVSNPEPEAIIFSDQPNGIPFSSVRVQYGSEYLYNKITATTQDSFATEQTVEVSASQQLYGIRSLAVSNLLNATDDGARDVAEDLLATYYEPRLRVESVEVNMRNITLDQQVAVLDLEIDDYIEVSFIPNPIQVPDGEPQITRGLLTGIRHNITTTTHVVELTLRPQLDLFVLNSDSQGILDEDILGP
jgi:hypothetical protein